MTAEDLSYSHDNISDVADMLKAGIKVIQYREKEKSGLEMYRQCIKIREMYIAYGNQMADKSYSCMKKLMSLSKPPTAVFCGNNQMSLGALRYMFENGMRAGDNVAIIGFDDIDVLNDVGIPLSVVDRSEKDMGGKAMEILLRHINDSDAEVAHISVPTRLILRGSEKAKL